jgi:mannose-6-phosphate isomerase-like protein (cupin superfamily)
MEIVRCWQEQGITIQEPYRRCIRVFLAPDRRRVPEITFSHALIYPGSKTDYHVHDRPELIQILSGRGVCICDGEKTDIGPDMALWVRKGERHQVMNDGEETIKLATVFVPAYTAEESYQRCQDAAAGGAK